MMNNRICTCELDEYLSNPDIKNMLWGHRRIYFKPNFYGDFWLK